MLMSSSTANYLSMTLPKFYDKGLRFACTECGQCCTGAPGYVYVTESEIEEMAAFLKVTPAAFKRLYVRRVGQKLSLVERKNYDCVFLEGKKCTLYGHRPKQCRTFPFWPHLLNEKAWKEAATTCEGIGEGPLLSKEEIEAIAF